MRSFFTILEKYATKRICLVGVFLIVLFNIILFYNSSQLLAGKAVDEKSILDLKFSYSPEFAYTFFENLDEEGRNTYTLSEIFIDFPYAIIYGFTYAFMILILLKTNQLKKLIFLSFVPFLISWFDILENTGIVAMLLKYPEKMENICNITATFTTLKWIFAIITFLIIVLNLIYLTISKAFLNQD